MKNYKQLSYGGVLNYFWKRLFGNIEKAEYGQQRFLSCLFCAIGIVVCSITGINALVLENYLLSAFLLSTTALLALTFYILRSSKYYRYHNLVRSFGLGSVLALNLYLVYSGGVNNSGPLWIYIVPFVAFAFRGLVMGIIVSLSFCCFIAFLLFYLDGQLLATEYVFEFKTRLIYSFLTITAISGFYEAARHKSYQDLKLLTLKYEKEAREDELTLLPNRRGMREILRKVSLEQEQTKEVLSIALCDIDSFKGVNDSYGHDVGDLVLQHVGTTLNEYIRAQGSQFSLSRWGGEEFLLLLPNTNEQQAFIILDSMRQYLVERPYATDSYYFSITLSAGVCETSSNIDINEAIRLSDISLYKAKQAGRNRVFGHHIHVGSSL